MQLSQKQETFSPFLVHFWNLSDILNVLKKKMTLIGFFISEIKGFENVVRQMPKKSRFRRPFDKQHGRHAEALFKSASHDFYHIYWSLPS